MVSVAGVLGALLGLETVTVFIFALHHLSYNIPVVVLRFTGNKERPLLFITKAKKRINKGVPRLWVKGYKTMVRDFLNEHYYPTIRGKHGGLVLWEFEDGLLTPTVPVKTVITPEHRESLQSAVNLLRTHQMIKFSYDERLHHHLKLKAVDDVDVEFALQEYLRIDNQYTTGWRDFMAKYSTAITFIILGILALAGWVVFLKEQPSLVANCWAAGKEGVSEVLKEYAGNLVTPGG